MLELKRNRGFRIRRVPGIVPRSANSSVPDAGVRDPFFRRRMTPLTSAYHPDDATQFFSIQLTCLYVDCIREMDEIFSFPLLILSISIIIICSVLQKINYNSQNVVQMIFIVTRIIDVLFDVLYLSKLCYYKKKFKFRTFNILYR